MNKNVYKVIFPVALPEVDELESYDNGRPEYILIEPFEVHVYYGYVHRMIVIPKELIFDYASSPRIVWSIIPPYDPKYSAGALTHDFLYQSQYFPRKVSDDLLLAALIARGVPAWKRNIMYAAVRIGGGSSYGKYKKKLIKSRSLMSIFDYKTIPLYKEV